MKKISIIFHVTQEKKNLKQDWKVCPKPVFSSDDKKNWMLYKLKMKKFM